MESLHINNEHEPIDPLTEFISKIRQAQSREAFVIPAEDNKEAKELFDKERRNL